jgi:hypothetical protein
MPAVAYAQIADVPRTSAYEATAGIASSRADVRHVRYDFGRSAHVEYLAA